MFSFQKIKLFPYSLIRFLHKDRIVLFESNGRGEASKLTEVYARERQPINADERCVAGFSESWLDQYRLNSFCEKYKLPLSFTLQAWQEYLQKQSKLFFSENADFFERNRNYPTFFIILGALGELQLMREKTSMVECLRGTLQVIASAYPNCNVVLKPHIHNMMWRYMMLSKIAQS